MGRHKPVPGGKACAIQAAETRETNSSLPSLLRGWTSGATRFLYGISSMKNRRTSKIVIKDIEVQVVRKKIKNMHLSVHPPEGDVRISVPLFVDDDQVRSAITSRLSWISRKQRYFREKPRHAAASMVTGESHRVFGKPYRLEVIERWGRHEIKIANDATLLLYVRPGTGTAYRRKVLHEWHRSLLKERIPVLLKNWEHKMGVKAAHCGVKRMRTRWGSCNPRRKRIWMNLELATKPAECLEYVLVHELVHLLERHHNEHFKLLLSRFLPGWEPIRDTLRHEQPALER